MALALAAFHLGSGATSSARQPPLTTESNIAKLAARILEQSQYSHHALDKEMGGKFLERYLEELDGQHLNFLQSDLEEFAPYRTTLNELIKAGNINPAHVVYDHFLHRLGERAAYARELLKTETFVFAGQDSYAVERRDLPRPKDLAGAKALWRQRLRYEYLEEKLNNKKPSPY